MLLFSPLIRCHWLGYCDNEPRVSILAVSVESYSKSLEIPSYKEKVVVFLYPLISNFIDFSVASFLTSVKIKLFHFR